MSGRGKKSWNKKKKKSILKPVSFLSLAPHQSILEYDEVWILNLLLFKKTSTAKNWRKKNIVSKKSLRLKEFIFSLLSNWKRALEIFSHIPKLADEMPMAKDIRIDSSKW